MVEDIPLDVHIKYSMQCVSENPDRVLLKNKNPF